MAPNFFSTALRMGVPFGLGMGAFYQMQGQNGLVLGPVLGVLFGVAMAVFVLRQHKRMGVPGETLDGDRILHQGPANHSAGLEKRGGWLVLTERALVFRAHGFNVQSEPLHIPLAAVRAVLPARTLGIFPNAVRVERTDGGPAEFVVGERPVWLQVISDALRGPSSLT